VNTFVLLGLVVALALFLVRSRTRASGDDAPVTRPARGLGRRGRRAEPEPAPVAESPPAFVSAPSPFASPVETFTSTPAPLTPPAPFTPAAPAVSDWAPEVTIVEPGWPLPGEISGVWTGSRATPPAEAPAFAGAHETAATSAPMVELSDPAPAADPDPEPAPTSWEMPALAPLAPPPAPVALDATTGGAPPPWVPGAVEVTPAVPIWPADGGDLPAWRPERAAAPVDTLRTGAWAPAADAARSPSPSPAAGDDTGDLALPVWRPEHAVAAEPEPITEPDLFVPAPVVAPEVVTPGPAPGTVAAEPVVVADPEPEPVLTWSMPVPEPVAVAETPGPALPLREPDDLGAQSAEVSELVPAVLAALRPLVEVSDHVGVTPRMLVVLRTLATKPLSVGEVAIRMGVSRPVIADVATRLDAAGLVRRERDERDRRRVRLVPTDRGRRLDAETADAPPAGAVALALAGMDPVERAALLSGLRALSRSASA